jgi:hypothetical protein
VLLMTVEDADMGTKTDRRGLRGEVGDVGRVQ